jgi:hypothetical protein
MKYKMGKTPTGLNNTIAIILLLHNLFNPCRLGGCGLFFSHGLHPWLCILNYYVVGCVIQLKQFYYNQMLRCAAPIKLCAAVAATNIVVPCINMFYCIMLLRK